MHTLPLAEQRAAYDRYVVPQSRRVPRDSLLARADFNKPHAPLLLIGGSLDTIIPASLNQPNYAKYRASGSVTEYKEFAGRTHFIIWQPDWQEGQITRWHE